MFAIGGDTLGTLNQAGEAEEESSDDDDGDTDARERANTKFNQAMMGGFGMGYANMGNVPPPPNLPMSYGMNINDMVSGANRDENGESIPAAFGGGGGGGGGMVMGGPPPMMPMGVGPPPMMGQPLMLAQGSLPPGAMGGGAAGAFGQLGQPRAAPGGGHVPGMNSMVQANPIGGNNMGDFLPAAPQINRITPQY